MQQNNETGNSSHILVEEMLKDWKEYMHFDIGTKQDETSFIYIKLAPRIKWFHPPLWKIFMWAYRIEKVTEFKNCHPA